ncbi:MAG: transglutaminase family protein [Verrucomicrobiaceae bacterium]|nr:transglutaminase family protein [Verrucomicrobiaceae bacterium]
MKHRSVIVAAISLILVVCLQSVRAADLKGELQGVIVWFYSLEVKDGATQGNVLTFKETAGFSRSHHIIHDIRPLSPQSKVSQNDDGNWFLDLAPDRIVVKKDRPLFLGQVLGITKSGNVPIQFKPGDNVLLSDVKFDADLARYVADRKDILIHDPAITEVRDQLLKEHPRILSYIIAVDRFVCDHLKYGSCKRPNTAVDLLGFAKGRCGEYTRLKLALLRSAGIPTRDVYAARTDPSGPGVVDGGGDDTHVWLQVFVPGTGWIDLQSTKKLNNNQFHSFLGGDHAEGRYLRTFDMFKTGEDVQTKVYTYNALRQPGFVRGNGLLLKIAPENSKAVQALTSKILDYDSAPDAGIFAEIESLPQPARPLLYWFLISVPDRDIHQRAASAFIKELESSLELKLESFRSVSPTLVLQRIDEATRTSKPARTN